MLRTPGPIAILDTQVVLDWLVFHDPTAAPMAAAIEGGHLRWLASATMRAELERVLARGVGAAWNPDPGAVMATFDRLASRAEPGPLPQPGLHCTDPSDQVFIDLAISIRATWLLSRDAALLRLARRARALGVIVTRPADWSSSGAATA
jgi:predicted nucleic acid-binding protein